MRYLPLCTRHRISGIGGLDLHLHINKSIRLVEFEVEDANIDISTCKSVCEVAPHARLDSGGGSSP